MKFHPDGPSIPDILLERCDAGRVVFLCGAGVSLPSGMPDFVDLTRYVIEFFDPPTDSDIMKAFQPWLGDRSGANVPLDQIFNLLHLEYGKDEVNALVTERLSIIPTSKDRGREHALIKRISSSHSGVPQIVTTNFDRLFEEGPGDKFLVFYEPPAFPDLNFGSKIEGITYLHGRLVDAASNRHRYVLSSADFGRAYLSEGWATTFIRHLLERYTVVLVGYQAEDPPIKYLLQGLNHDGQYDRSRLYAFDRGLPEEVEAKWRDRGVTAVAYSDHPALWKSMEAWADRVDDPRKWRKSIVANSLQDPKDLASHERGQVAHVLRTVQGARLFSEADPVPHPEWVCVMDANVRSAKPSSSFSDDEEVFDPVAAYGLDDDLTDTSKDDRSRDHSNDNLLAWRGADDNPHDFHRLAGRQPEGFETIPIRLGHLKSWISKSIDSPVLAWWAIRQNGLHPGLLKEIEWQVKRSEVFHDRARHIWRLILEHHRDPLNRQQHYEWFDLKKRINAEGWTASVLREFRKVTTPRLVIKRPYGLRLSRPPSVHWEEIHFSDLGQFEVVFFKHHNKTIEIPDERLPQVFRLFEEQLIVASVLLADIESSFFQTPTCYPNREVEGRVGTRNDGATFFAWFVKLFNRMAATWPELACAHATTWPATDSFFFRKLKIYAFSKVDVFKGDHVAEEILSLDQEKFWDRGVIRELLFLLVDRWAEFSLESRNQLNERILSGPNKLTYESEDAFTVRRNNLAARYTRYLELKGCELTAGHSERLSEMIKGIPDWNDRRATSTVIEMGSCGGIVVTDEKPDAVLNLPVNAVLSKAREELKQDFHSLTDKRPFTGLVKANPRKALSALTNAGKAGDYPEDFWSVMIKELPADIKPRLRRVFLNRLARLPYAVIAELRYTLGQWLKQNLVAVLDFDDDLGWTVYDYIVDGIVSGGADATKSGMGEVSQAGKVIERSRRTLIHAINSPIGECTQALFNAVPVERQKAGSLIPGHIKSRVERLFDAPGEGSDHAVSVTCRNLNWLMFVDPVWTKERLISMLAVEHPASEPAWNGLLQCSRELGQPLAEIIKPLLLNLFPRVERFLWDGGLSTVAAQWLGYMRVFHLDEPSGLTRSEMRSVLRAMSDDTRCQFIFWLGQVGQSNENGWAKHVLSVINEDWPRERQYRTNASTRAWIDLLDETGDSFPDVYDAAKKFMVTADTNDFPFYQFTRENNDEAPIAAQFPETTLDLMDRVTPQILAYPSYELTKVLTLIVETKPALTSDPRYLRLVDLVERS
jgi:hypothetical protein